MITKRLGTAFCALLGALLVLLACGATPSAPTALEITLTFAKDAAQPLTDSANVGGPAAGCTIHISAMKQKAQGGQPVYIAGDPLFTLTTDAEGKARVELPPNQYLVEVLDADGNVVAKQLPQLVGGQTLKLSFNIPPQ